MSIEVNERPLVTFFVCAYQQERFIREAVEGAFAQTYSPLEIILSDDCSSDRTFDIMREMAAAYRGPHQIILNRNEKNLGIGGHINRIFELSRGELLVASAGDDVSLPERTGQLAGRWLASNREAKSLFSNGRIINSDGQFQRLYWDAGTPTIPWSLEEVLARRDCGLFGFSHAFSSELFRVFGPLNSSVVYEDRVLPLRAMLLGRIEYLPLPLVNYRLHDGNFSAQVRRLPLPEGVCERRKFVARREAVCSAQWLKDILQAPAPLSPAMIRAFERLAVRESIKAKVFGKNPIRASLGVLAYSLRTKDLNLTTYLADVVFWTLAAAFFRAISRHRKCGA